MSSVTETATEDPDTRTNEDTAYSQFYKQSGNWYWKLTSDKRGTIEVGKVSRVKKSDGDEIISVTSQVYEPGTNYQQPG